MSHVLPFTLQMRTYASIKEKSQEGFDGRRFLEPVTQVVRFLFLYLSIVYRRAHITFATSIGVVHF